MLQNKLVVGLGETRIDYSMDATMPLQLVGLLQAEGQAGIEMKKLVKGDATIASRRSKQFRSTFRPRGISRKRMRSTTRGPAAATTREA